MVKEIKVKLNTGDTGQVNFKTKKMVGKLNCILVDVEFKEPTEQTKKEEPDSFRRFYNQFRAGLYKPRIDFIIQSKFEYTILSRSQVEGMNYFAPRVRIVPSEDDMRDILTFGKFKLNEELLITIIGLQNTDISLVFRLD